MHTDRTPPMSKNFHYIADGLTKGIKLQMDTGYDLPNNLIRLELNIDGVPVFKSPPTGFWPILCRVLGTNDQCPFLCGAYCGESKPPNLNNFLNPVIDDILRLQQDGFVYNGELFRVELARVICDVPARSFVKATKGHTGEFKHF